MATTAHMSLSLPTVSVTAGPAWASALNAALTVIDAHDHSPGSGRPIRSPSLAIDADVSWNGFNLTTLRSLRLANQGAALSVATDIGCVFEAGGDLYFNNSAGQHIQITAGAALNAASLGGIGGDYSTSTASMFYTAAATAFSLWSAANKYASLDMGSLTIREPGASSPKGVTVQSATSLAADYALTLPTALPGSTLPLLVSSAGAMSLGTITQAMQDGTFAPKASPTFTGTVTLPNTGAGANEAATRAFVENGPAFSAKPTAPATLAGDGSATLATKGYVDNSAGYLAAESITYGANWSTVSFKAYRDRAGVVHFGGSLSPGAGFSNFDAVTLPAGWRPGHTYTFAIPDNFSAFVSVNMNTDGTLDFIGSLTAGHVYYVSGVIYLQEN